MIKFQKLYNLIQSRGIKTPVTWLRKDGRLSPTIVNKLSKLWQEEDNINPDSLKTINSDTINRLCSLLDCQPGDIMEYVPDHEAGGNDN